MFYRLLSSLAAIMPTGRDFTKLVAAVMAAIVLASCAGGGTIGTSQTRPARLSGSIASTQGEPLAGVVVTVLESGETTISNANGEFELVSELEPDEFNVVTPSLLFQGESFESVLEVGPIKENEPGVSISVEVDTILGEIQVLSLKIEGRDPVPTPTPVSTPGSKPTSPKPPTTDNDKGDLKQSSLIQGTVVSNTGEGIKGVPIAVFQRARRVNQGVSKVNGSFSFEALIDSGPIEMVVGKSESPVGKLKFKVAEVPAIVTVKFALQPFGDGSSAGPVIPSDFKKVNSQPIKLAVDSISSTKRGTRR